MSHNNGTGKIELVQRPGESDNDFSNRKADFDRQRIEAAKTKREQEHEASKARVNADTVPPHIRSFRRAMGKPEDA